MKTLSKLLLIAICSACLFAACKKDKTTPSDTKQGISLKSKSLAEIKSLMAGRWNLHYSVSWSPTYFVYRTTNSYWELTTTDTLLEVYDGNFYARQKIVFTKSNYNGDSWLMSGTQTGAVNDYILDSLRSDTLISTYIGTRAKTYLTK